jgi:hypothetical protein
MMEKAYYEKIAPQMFKDYFSNYRTNAQIQSREYVASMNNITRLQNELTRIQGQQYAADRQYQRTVDAANIRGQISRETTNARLEVMKQLQKDKLASPVSLMKLYNSEWARNTQMQRSLTSSVAQLNNALVNIDLDNTLTPDQKQMKKDSINSMIEDNQNQLNNLFYANDQYKALTEQVLMQNPSLASTYGTDVQNMGVGSTTPAMPPQQPMTGGGGTGGGGSTANNPLFYNAPGQQPATGPVPQLPTQNTAQAPTTATPQAAAGTTSDDDQASIIARILGKSPKSAAP